MLVSNIYGNEKRISVNPVEITKRDTLGNGEGNNWWCVLFPPLCVMEAEEQNTSDITYKSFVKEILEKYF